MRVQYARDSSRIIMAAENALMKGFISRFGRPDNGDFLTDTRQMPRRRRTDEAAPNNNSFIIFRHLKDEALSEARFYSSCKTGFLDFVAANAGAFPALSGKKSPIPLSFS